MRVIGCEVVGEVSRDDDELSCPCITAWVGSDGMGGWGEHCGCVVTYIRLNRDDRS